MGRFIWQTSPNRAILTLALMLISTFTDGLSILFLLPLLSRLSKEQDTGLFELEVPYLRYFSNGFHLDLLHILTLFILLIAFGNYINRLKTVLVAETLLSVLNELRFSLFKSISEAKWSFVSSQRFADLDHALTGDIDRVQAAMTNLILFVQNSILIVFLALISCTVSFEVTALVSALGVALLVLMAPFRAKASAFGTNVTHERKHQYRATSDFLLGLKVAKSFNAQHQYQQQFVKALVNLKRLTVSFAKLSSTANFFFQTSTSIAACVFTYVAIEVLALPVSRIIVLIVIFSRISPRLAVLQGYLQGFATNFSAFDNMLKIQAAAKAAREAIEQTGLLQASFETTLEMRGVSFGYGARDVLHDVDLRIEQRQITALVGPSGSGKSTVADLLLGLQHPSSGDILVDGVSLSRFDLESWRASNVSYVQQDAYLFSGTLRDNLRLAHPSASDDEIWYALNKAQAIAFVQALPMGLETLVGDGAIMFSGGERQRLSLARALVRQPNLLILDEATSGLDGANTALIIELVRELAAKMAVLIITHDENVAAAAHCRISIVDGHCYQESIDRSRDAG